MEKLLKPGQLVIDPNSPTAGRDWKHWIRRFDGYVSQFTGLMTEGEAEKYKLSVLVNYAVSDVYDYFDHCTTYSEAEAVLNELFVKEPYEIFARYELLTTKQKVNQSLADFGCTLNKLAKDCNFASVTAAEHKDAMVRDAFIAGISSPAIRQRLLEHQKLSYREAYRLAVTFDDARRNNLKFGSPPDAKVESAMAADDVDFPTNAPLSWKETDQSAFVANRTSGRCMHCGNNRPHDMSCKARMVTALSVVKQGTSVAHAALIQRSVLPHAMSTSEIPQQSKRRVMLYICWGLLDKEERNQLRFFRGWKTDCIKPCLTRDRQSAS